MLVPEVAAGGSRRWTRRRHATIAAVALGVTVGGIAAAALVRPGRSHGDNPPIAAKPIAGSAGAPGSGAESAAPAATAAPTPSTAPTPTAAPPSSTAPPASTAPTTRTGDRDATLAACAELQRAQRWKDLDGCSLELAKLGADGKAEQLRATARQELQNEQLDGEARHALRGGNLQQARAALQQIDTGSVYLTALHDAFAAADQQRTDEARRRAQQLAAAHDCAGLRRLIAQLTASGTERVVAAAQDVTCSDDAPADPAGRPAAPADRAAARPAAPPASIRRPGRARPAATASTSAT
jgi:hypothetical protein